MNMVQRHGEATCLSCMVPWPGRAGYEHGSAAKFSSILERHAKAAWFHGRVELVMNMVQRHGAECPSGSGIQNPETE